ncbi:MAG: type II secretion system F family protein [Candidatus Dojkabacteria bacterium]|jgi:type IV pilus assembly protein PilC|nr:type II secretion system F family protein [Candidatus Dojkabacteria bacterium]
MKKFKYSARTVDGKEVKGSISARDEAAVAEILHDKGLVIVNIKDSFDFNLEKLSEINIGGVPLNDKVIFMRQMATMVSAGLPLTRSLEIMELQASNPQFRNVISSVKKGVESGQGLAESFRAQEEIFDEVTLNLIEAGESSGKLDVILLKLAVELEEKKSLGSKLKGALIYPAIILLVIVAVILLLMFILVPAMSDIYSEFDAELPWTTTLLINMSNFMTTYWWAVLVVVVVLGVGGKVYFGTEKGKRVMDKIVLKIPVVKDVVTKTQVAQFSRIMALLLSSGLSILQALELSAKSLSNSLFRDVILDARDEVEKGGSLTVPIARSQYYPLLVSSMIAVGEETGNLDVVLEKVATYFKEEVNEATSNLSSILEPIFLVVMGVTIGFIAMAVYMPMFQLSSVMT